MLGTKGQMKAIKDYLESGNSLTSMEAYKKFGCTKLPSRISDLRKSGMAIKTIMMEGETKYGTPTRYAKYIIIK
jgi:hypothetical protein